MAAPPPNPPPGGIVHYSKAIRPLLEWDLDPGAVSGLVSAVATLAPLLHSTKEDGWVTPFSLLACDYLRAAGPAIEPAPAQLVTVAVSSLTKVLLDRLGQLGLTSPAQIAQAEDLSDGVLSLAGGAALPARARARQQAALTLALPSLPGTVSGRSQGRRPRRPARPCPRRT